MNKITQQIATVGMAVTLLTTGCASIVSKSAWPVTVTSNPSGAELSITDVDSNHEVFHGTTPTTITLDSSPSFFEKAKYDVEVKLAGYNVGKGRITAKINGWYFGNIVFGGIIGLVIVDPATGAMYKLPPQYCVNMSKLTASTSDKPTLQIVSVSDVPSDLRSKLIRLN